MNTSTTLNQSSQSAPDKAEQLTTGWLADKLDEYQSLGNYATCALVLAVGEGEAGTTELVYSDQDNKFMRLSKINELMEAGAKPIGWIGFTHRHRVNVWPLPNYKDNPEVEAFLEEVRRQATSQLLADIAASAIII